MTQCLNWGGLGFLKESNCGIVRCYIVVDHSVIFYSVNTYVWPPHSKRDQWKCVLKRKNYNVQDLEAVLFKELLKRLGIFYLKKRILIGDNSHSESEFLHLWYKPGLYQTRLDDFWDPFRNNISSLESCHVKEEVETFFLLKFYILDICSQNSSRSRLSENHGMLVKKIKVVYVLNFPIYCVALYK